MLNEISLFKSNIYAKLFCTHTGYRYNLKIYPIQIIQRVAVLLDQLPSWFKNIIFEILKKIYAHIYKSLVLKRAN